MAAVELILLQRVEKLGQMGDVVKVKPGYARNFLLPQKKALRASKDNRAKFEQQRAQLEAQNIKRREEAERVAERVGRPVRRDHPPGGRVGQPVRLGVGARHRRRRDRGRADDQPFAGGAGASDQDAGPVAGPGVAASGSLDPGHRQRRAQPRGGRAAGPRRAGERARPRRKSRCRRPRTSSKATPLSRVS